MAEQSKILSVVGIHKLIRMYMPVLGFFGLTFLISEKEYWDTFFWGWLGVMIYQSVLIITFNPSRNIIWTFIGLVIPSLTISLTLMQHELNYGLLFFNLGIIDLAAVIFTIYLIGMIDIYTSDHFKKEFKKKGCFNLFVNVFAIVAVSGMFFMFGYLIVLLLLKLINKGMPGDIQYKLIIGATVVFTIFVFFRRIKKFRYNRSHLKPILIHILISSICFWGLIPLVYK